MTTWLDIETRLARMESEFIVARSLRPPTGAEVAAEEKRLGACWPASFRELLCRVDALYVEAREDVWPIQSGGPAWIFFRGVMTFGFGDDLPQHLRLENRIAETRDETRSALGGSGLALWPCLRVVADPRVYAFDAEGTLVQWDHECESPERAEGDIFDVLGRTLDELVDGAARMRARR